MGKDSMSYTMRTVLAAVVILTAASLEVSAAEIGRVKTVRGVVEVERGGTRTVLTENPPLEQNDALVTGPDGAIGAILTDGSTISLGPRGRLVLDEVLFDPAHDRLSLVTRAVSGTFAYASGQIGKLAPEKVVVKTPVMTIGIRGTSFLIEVEED